MAGITKRVRLRRVVGISLGEHDAVACFSARGTCRTVERRGLQDAAAALASLLTDPAIVSAARRGGVRIALLPPATEDRVVSLPGLDEARAERALAFRAEHHFARGESGLVVTATAVSRAAGVFLASAVPAQLIDAVHSVTAASKVRCVGVHPATHGMFVAANGPASNLIMHAGVLVAAVRSSGRLSGLRRVPIDSPAAREALEEAGVGSEMAPKELADSAPAVARAMVHVTTAEFRSNALRVGRSRRARLRNGTMIAAAEAALLLAGGLEAWSARRDLRDVQNARANARPLVDAALADRERYRKLFDAVRSISGNAAAPSVSELLQNALAAIPSGTQLDVLEIADDELVLAGTAPAADAVYAELRASAVAEDVQWIGPVRRIVEDGSRREAFSIAAAVHQNRVEP